MLRATLILSVALWSVPVAAEIALTSRDAIDRLNDEVANILKQLADPTAGNSFATAPRIGNGVRTDGNNPLGRYFPVAGTDKVSFSECGSDESVIIDASLVLPTSETCKSLPGTGAPSFPNSASVRWVYDADKNGFFVTAEADTDNTMAAGAQFVDCSTVPSSLLLAARKAREGVEGVVGPSDALSALNVASDKKTEASPTERATVQQCKTVDEFWTLQSAQTLERAEDRLIGVTREAPRSM
ncbi:hypothetical protein LC092_04205 [Stappia stellulata]|uniref:hypothetical protein n=1 Tax=Stappia stellulata TaxID=71235 RepID=UPI001CD67233|nr:hypothetical protein [Stappia stellulata]MCA1241634.1 hypothetical protein [Stappia stellulata]